MFQKWIGQIKTYTHQKQFNLGDEVEIMILEIDEDRRRLSLGMKQCKQNPWEDFCDLNIQKR